MFKIKSFCLLVYDNTDANTECLSSLDTTSKFFYEVSSQNISTSLVLF